MIYLGGPLFTKYTDPETWLADLRQSGYWAAYCPIAPSASRDEITAYEQAAQQHGILISEVGVWKNPLSSKEEERQIALEQCKASLALADEIGARCCVNIAGSRGVKWDGPDPSDLTAETFDLIVESVRDILHAVKPSRTDYTLETMPWMYPDSIESYERLIQAINHPHFAVHFDPVNLIQCPQRYFHNGAYIQEFVKRLGAFIRSCHAKDILLGERLTVHLDEVRPGLGKLDYASLLHSLDALPQDVPLMLEHLSQAEDYSASASYIRQVAAQEQITIVA